MSPDDRGPNDRGPNDRGPNDLTTGGGGSDDDRYAAALRRVLADQARRMDPTDPLDSALTRIQARTDAAVTSAPRRWLAPLLAAAAVLALVVAGTLVWPHLSPGTPVGAASSGPHPTSALPTASPSASTTSSATPAPQLLVPVYFGGTYAGRTMLYREFHRTGAAALTGALEAMLAGPTDPDYACLWAKGTALVGLTRSGSKVTVTLSGAPLLSQLGAGAYGASSVQEVVYTVTAADPTVRAVTVAWPGGQVAAATRAPDATVLASVWVLSPAQGAAVSSPVTLSGTASVFEATVTWEVDRADGAPVAHGFAMASIGAPGRGPWSVTVALPPGSYLLKAYAVSPKDGSHTWTDTKAFTVR